MPKGKPRLNTDVEVMALEASRERAGVNIFRFASTDIALKCFRWAVDRTLDAEGLEDLGPDDDEIMVAAIEAGQLIGIDVMDFAGKSSAVSFLSWAIATARANRCDSYRSARQRPRIRAHGDASRIVSGASPARRGRPRNVAGAA